MQSVIRIAESIFYNDENMKFLLTYKMSEDHLETFFAAIRSRSGCNNNSSVRQFKAAYRCLLAHVEDVQISKAANCQPIDSTKLLTISKSLQSTKEHGIDSVLSVDLNSETQSSVTSGEVFQNSWCITEYAENVIAYIAGFIRRFVRSIIK